MKNFLKFSILFLLVVLFGCGTQDGASTSTDADTTTDSSVTVAAIVLSSAASTLAHDSATTLTISLYDDSGQVVAESKTVSLTVDQPSFASVDSSVTTSTGVAEATFSSRSTNGTVTITASVDGTSEALSIIISDGSGSAVTTEETATVSAMGLSATSLVIAPDDSIDISGVLYDSSGQIVATEKDVAFSLDDPLLGSISSSVTTATGSLTNTFQGRGNEGEVTITASVDGATQSLKLTLSNDPVDDSAETDTVDAIGLVVNNNIIGTNATATVTASLYDSSGQSIAAAKTITFTLSDPTLGSIDTLVTTSTGSLQTDFESRNLEGNLQIIAAVDGVTQQVALTISDDLTSVSDEEAAVTAMLLTADNSTIGTGETATITAQLLDASGQTITDPKTVTFTLDDPTLAFINSPGSTSSGILTRSLTAKTSEGTVTVTATVDGYSQDIAIDISDALAPASVAVAASPATITVAGTTVVQATVLDENSDPIADGTSVSFSVNNTNLGAIVPTASVSGGAGVAQATFTAGLEAGTAVVTAQSGSVTGTANVVIASADAGSIEFTSAEPQIISIQGTGGLETSTIKFLVKDTNGNPVIGSLAVDLELSGPNGGEYIGPNAGVTQLEVGTVDGFATVVLHSGNIPGTATITASLVDNPGLTTSSGVIAIGGGTPSADHFSLSATTLNLAGFAYDGLTTDITVRLADRVGNYNILEGTAVSFYSECGAIDRAVNLDSEGVGTVTLRTQSPRAYDVDGDNNDPEDGLCTITVVVDGEEEFTDANASGTYNSGESFVDTFDDIFIDKDDNDIHTGTYEDLIVDRNEDGNFDGINGIWDANKRIYKEIKILFTGVPSLVLTDDLDNPISTADTIEIEENGTVDLKWALQDARGNLPIAGTTIDVTSDLTVSGTTSYKYLDSSTPGSPAFSISIAAGDKTPGEVFTLEASWTWNGGDYAQSYLVEIIAAP